MKIYTDRPIYSYAGGMPLLPSKKDLEALSKSNQASTSMKTRGTSLMGTTVSPDKIQASANLTPEQKLSADKFRKKQEKQSNRAQKQDDRKKYREEKKALRKAKRNAKKLLRAKDKTGRKKWFYPIARVFKGKKKQSDGTIVDVDPQNIVTTKSGVQFDKTEISTATGIPAEQVTAQVAESVVVTNPQTGSQPTENTTLTPFVAKREDTDINPNASAEEVLKSVTTVYVPVNQNKEVVQGNDGGMYMSEETVSQEEPISDEEFNAMKKSKNQDQEEKGIGVWGWVGISAIILGLGIGGYLIYNMSNAKK